MKIIRFLKVLGPPRAGGAHGLKRWGGGRGSGFWFLLGILMKMQTYILY